LNETHLKPEIVFVTAYDKYAIEAFKYAAFHYLLKPIDKEDLSQTIERLEKKLETESFAEKVKNLIQYLEPNTRIKLNTRVGYILIDPEEIIYCMADGSYTEIYLKNNTKHISTFHLGKISGLLPETLFFRISRSIIINLSCLKEINRKKKTCILIYGNEEIIFDIPQKQLKELENVI
jgi:DNA-binding LytR/AlgR family response regulator